MSHSGFVTTICFGDVLVISASASGSFLIWPVCLFLLSHYSPSFQRSPDSKEPVFTGTMHQNNNLIFLGKTTSGMLDNEGREKSCYNINATKPTDGITIYLYIYIYYFSSYFRVDLLEKSICIQIPYPTLVFVSSTPPPKKTMEVFFWRWIS